MASYTCDQCGACCRQLIIEIEHVDVIREPRLLDVAPLLDGHGSIQFDSEWDKPYGLACGSRHPCPMLGEDNRCTIYPTRPTVCVAFEAGSYQCHSARQMAGLPLLPDDDGRTPTAAEIEAMEP